ncbi:MAG TPA: hypothetical protein VGM51_00805 [Armatimonadota bacterium]|jgi:hypothetical protein
MRPALYHWKHMARDYYRFLVDEKWRWCSQCHRPVEHAFVPPIEGGSDVPACLDCGFSDTEVLRSLPWPPATGS